MTITSITYHCPTDGLGDNVTEQDADGYRAWVQGRLESEFPGADITVTDEQRTHSVETDADGDDYAAIEHVNQFLDRCWDSCKWEWVSLN